MRLFFGPALLAGLLLACSSSDDRAPAPDPATGNTGQPKQERQPQPEQQARPVLPIWHATSTKIELSSFGFFSGSTGYAKARADMTAEQLTALDNIRTLAKVTEGVEYDAVSYRVLVTDQDGSVAEFRAAQGDFIDSDEGGNAASKTPLEFASLQPFLGTIKCLSAKSAVSTPRDQDAPADPSKADLSTAVKLPLDTGCQNGVFVPYSCSDTFLTFEVAAAGTYEIADTHCLEQMSMRLYTADGATMLAESTPAAGAACFTLRHTFGAGTYLLHLIKTNAAGCGATAAWAGDTTLVLTAL